MTDCRFLLDNLNDFTSLEGQLVSGSDVVDISGAEMTAVTDGWKVLIKTVSPAQQNPRLEVSAAVYIDADGRMDNNATAGPRLGADTVYGIVYSGGEWKITRETFNAEQNAFLTVDTQATYSIANEGYALNIPYAELAKTSPAFWKAGVAEKDTTRLTIDYVPDNGLSCVPSLAPQNAWLQLAVKAKGLWVSGLGDQVIAGAVVIAALIVIFWRWKRGKKNNPT